MRQTDIGHGSGAAKPVYLAYNIFTTNIFDTVFV